MKITSELSHIRDCCSFIRVGYDCTNQVGCGL